MSLTLTPKQIAALARVQQRVDSVAFTAQQIGMRLEDQGRAAMTHDAHLSELATAMRDLETLTVALATARLHMARLIIDVTPPAPMTENCGGEDCAQRATCLHSGESGHHMCGMCTDHNRPRHHCGGVIINGVESHGTAVEL